MRTAVTLNRSGTVLSLHQSRSGSVQLRPGLVLRQPCPSLCRPTASSVRICGHWPTPRALSCENAGGQLRTVGGQVPRQLNERQLQVLRWVGQGCPDGIWQGEAHKLSCQALQSRGLVKVSRGKGQWTATLTTAGQHFLDHGSHPPDKSRATGTAPVQKPQRSQQSPPAGRKPATRWPRHHRHSRRAPTPDPEKGR
jgi:hypothetical protein